MIEEINKVLVISTAHVTPKTLATYGAAGADDEPRYRVGQHPYGFWLYSAREDATDNDAPEDIRAIRAYAHSLGCRYINVDADADVSPNLKEYDHGGG